ncbi:MAG: hypothetical protein KAH57_03555, partial [Thermoplasmata archaeon]|nr:hypothetical protein [Thermoplasmata archaeon]
MQGESARIMNSIFEGGSYVAALIAPTWEIDSISNIELINNVFVYGASKLIFMQDPIDSMTWRNNIFTSNRSMWYTAMFMDDDHEPDYNGFELDHDLYHQSGSVRFYDAGNSRVFNFSRMQSTYGQEKNGLESDPLFTNFSTGDLSLSYLSPAIDAGGEVTLPYDFEGNPIYGPRDIGPYEYQPPYKMGQDPVRISGDIRLYEDGRYRYVASEPVIENSSFSLVPKGGYSNFTGVERRNITLDMSILNWSKTGEKFKRWSERDQVASSNITYHIGDLNPDTNYKVAVNGVTVRSVETNGTGYVSFHIVHTSKNRTITIKNDGSPCLLNDSSDISGTTGDDLTFSITAVDDKGVDNVTVQINCSSSMGLDGLYLSLSSGTAVSGIWTGSVTLPTNVTGNISYRVILIDGDSRSFFSEERTIIVRDDDIPIFSSDGSSSIATTGEEFTFKVSAIDNIGINSVYVDYLIDDAAGKSEMKVLNGTYQHTLKLPENDTRYLSYSFNATDVNGLCNVSSLTNVSIVDNDRPVLLEDISHGYSTTGEIFTLSASISDNLGLESVSVEYWFGTGTHNNFSIGGISPYSLNITIPDSSTSSLKYRFHAEDGAGNCLIPSQNIIAVTDNDLPEIISDTTLMTGGTGDLFSFSASVEDNVGVDN